MSTSRHATLARWHGHHHSTNLAPPGQPPVVPPGHPRPPHSSTSSSPGHPPFPRVIPCMVQGSHVHVDKIWEATYMKSPISLDTIFFNTYKNPLQFLLVFTQRRLNWWNLVPWNLMVRSQGTSKHAKRFLLLRNIIHISITMFRGTDGMWGIHKNIMRNIRCPT